MNEWQTLTLADVCTVITDGAHQSPKTVSRGKPMASVKDLTRFGVDLTSARHIATEDFEALVKQGCKPHVGDVLIAKDGNSALDTVCTVDHPLDAVLLSSVAILRPDPKCLDSVFLKFYLSSPETIDYLKSNFISGAAIPRVVLRDFKRAEIRLPSLDVQRRIAGVLQSIDSKIDLNRRVNQTLEAMAQAIFKSWFFDFDPVKAKIAAIEQGQDPLRAAMRAISGKTDAELDQMPREPHDQLAATAALFPDAMEESELGDIPKGWETLSFGDVAQQSKGVVNPGASLKASFTHYSLPAFDASQLPIVESGESIKSNKTPVPDNAVLVSKLNPHIPRIWLVGRAGERAVCSTEFIVWVPKFPANSAFVYGLASLSEFNIAMRQLVTGTSNSHQRVKPGQLAEIRVFVADKKTIAQYSATLAPLMEKVLCNRKEARRLAQLRDTLLPKLLSGELSVENLHKEVAV